MNMIAAIVAVLAMQATDVKFGDIKLPDVICLVMFLLMLVRNSLRIPKNVFYPAAMLFVILMESIVVSLGVDFYPIPNTSLLKQPYYLSVSRFVLLLGCVGFMWFVRDLVIRSPRFLKIVYRCLVVVLSIFVVLCICDRLGLKNFSAYDDDSRLRGLFNEGGPFGLCGAYLAYVFYCLGFLNYYGVAVFAASILLSKSKAGMMFVVITAGWEFYRAKRGKVRFASMLIALALSGAALTYLAQGYVASYSSAEYIAADRADDGNFAFGRVAGMYIAPKIVYDNPLFGVGLGNYSLVRNDPKYRGIFPEVDGWDLSGLGGLVTLLIENGLFGVLVLIAFGRYWIKASTDKMLAQKMLVASSIAMLCGVQIYFCYMWFGLGISAARSVSKNVGTGCSNRLYGRANK